jgi:hypothetical protein
VNAPTKPEVGMGATVLHYTDREAGTITYVHPNGRKLTFTLRANGRWVLAGQGLHKGTRLHIGDRAHYHDYSF